MRFYSVFRGLIQIASWLLVLIMLEGNVSVLAQAVFGGGGGSPKATTVRGREVDDDYRKQVPRGFMPGNLVLELQRAVTVKNPPSRPDWPYVFQKINIQPRPDRIPDHYDLAPQTDGLSF
jgi:hypothetical protein